MASLEQPETIKPTEAKDVSKSSQQPSKSEGGSIDEQGKDRRDAKSEDSSVTESNSKDAPAPAQQEESSDDDDSSDDEPPQPPGFNPRGRPTGPVAGGSKVVSKPRPTRP